MKVPLTVQVNVIKRFPGVNNFSQMNTVPGGAVPITVFDTPEISNSLMRRGIKDMYYLTLRKKKEPSVS
jgi:tRNA U34 5-carboxymethylaminomethyl modifying enzyme MnmG/GidA